MSYEQVQSKKVFSSETISAGGSATSEISDLYLAEGVFSLQLDISGDGTCKVEYEIRNSVDAPWIKTSGGTDWQTGLGSGNHHFPLEPPVATHIKFTITETGSTNSVTVSAWLAVR